MIPRAAMLAASACSAFALAEIALHPSAGLFAPFVIAVAVVGWLRARPRLAAASGACFGTVFFLMLFSWAISAGPQSPSLLAAGAAAVVESGYFAVIALLISRSGALGRFGCAVLVGSSWTLAEYAREVGTWALPYGEVGATQSETGFARLAPLVGTLGISFLLVFVSAWVAFGFVAVAQKRARSAAVPALVAVVFLAGVDAAGIVMPASRVVPVAGRGALVLQSPAIARANVVAFVRQLPVLAVRAAPATPVDLVALPEAVFRFAPSASDDRAMQGAARAIGVPIVIGTLSERGGRHYNAARVYDPRTVEVGEYDKRQLVPFGEFVPLASLFGHLTSLSRANLSPGDLPPSSYGTHDDVALLICFEAAFARFTRQAARDGAAYALVLVNDDWFASPVGLGLQDAVLSMRARESGIDFIVAASNGPSGVFRHDGSRQLFSVGRAMIAPVRPTPSEPTLYRATGDGPVLVVCALGLIFSAGRSACAITRRRRRLGMSCAPATAALGDP